MMLGMTQMCEEVMGVWQSLLTQPSASQGIAQHLYVELIHPGVRVMHLAPPTGSTERDTIQ